MTPEKKARLEQLRSKHRPVPPEPRYEYLQHRRPSDTPGMDLCTTYVVMTTTDVDGAETTTIGYSPIAIIGL